MSRRQARAASAVGAAVALVAAAFGTPPASAGTALPKPSLVHGRITPSACATRTDDTLLYSRRPTFRTTSRSLGDGRVKARAPRMQFEVWAFDASELETDRERADEGYRAVARGTAAPLTDRGATFVWRPSARLPEGDELVWRARVVSGGEPASAWSSWGMFIIRTDLPRLHECRVSGSEVEFYNMAAGDSGLTPRQLMDDQIWLGEWYGTAFRVGKLYPRAYVTAEVEDDHTRRAWIAFRGTAPAGAREAVARFRESHPGSRVRILTGRNYTEKQIQARADRVYDLARASGLVEDSMGGARMRDGAVELELEKKDGVTMTDAQFRDVVLAYIRAHVTGYQVIPSGGGALAGPRVQPVDISVVELEVSW